jgi:hypothetical protein
MNSYTYRYHATYGSDEILKQPLVISSAKVSKNGLNVRLKVAGLREMFVHELSAKGVRSAEDKSQSLLHSQAYYTLNQIPKSND